MPGDDNLTQKVEEQTALKADDGTQDVMSSPSQDEGDIVFDLEYVRKLREEAMSRRKKLREIEQELDKYKAEVEELRKNLAEAERIAEEKDNTLKQRQTEYETKLLAQNLGIVDPDVAWSLLNVSAIEFDNDGRPKNLEQLLKELVNKKPYLVNRVQYAATNPARSSPPIFTRAQLRDPKFFAENRDAIMEAMRDGRIVED